MTKVLVGLGNPGPQYYFTRHNIGARVIEELLHQISVEQKGTIWHSLRAKGIFQGEEIHLIRPLTFMNRSGIVVKIVVQRLKIPLESLLIVCDDFSLPFGYLRFRRKGSAGGHKGLESIEQALQTREFSRLRLGTGPIPQQIDPAEFVLSSFSKPEVLQLSQFLKRAVEAIFCWLENGMEIAMRTYNRRIPSQQN